MINHTFSEHYQGNFKLYFDTPQKNKKQMQN